MVLKHAQDRDHLNPFLGALGVLLLIVASVGMFLDRPEALIGGFLVAGVALCVFAVLTPRLEGSQEVGLTGAKFNVAALKQVIAQGEIEVRTERLAEIEEVF
jgi:hypothetical protein